MKHVIFVYTERFGFYGNSNFAPRFRRFSVEIQTAKSHNISEIFKNVMYHLESVER